MDNSDCRIGNTLDGDLVGFDMGLGADLMNEPIAFKSEKNIADEHKAKLDALLVQLAVCCQEARDDGFYVEFQVGLNQFGRYTVAIPAQLIKRF